MLVGAHHKPPPSPPPDYGDNPFKLPHTEMGPARRTIMWSGYLTILALGLAMLASGVEKHPIFAGAFCLAVPLFFAWLACWIGYK